MSCASGNCGNAFAWGIDRIQRGVRGGWPIQTIPDVYWSPAREFTWRNRREQRIDGPDQAVSELKRFLLQQGQTITDEDVAIIREHALSQYCASEENRCRHRKKNKAEKAAEAAGPDLPWAKEFWRSANTAIAADDKAIPALKAVVAMATILINGPEGCPKCALHWQKILETSNPDEIVKSADDARIWIWSAHNASREGKPEMPYTTIARMWKWPPLTADALKEAVTRMHLTDLP